MSVRRFSAVLGVVEVAAAALIAARPLASRASLVGSALAVGMFLTTLSFLFTTPGVWETSLGGFPALSAIPGQFLGVSEWLTAALLMWGFWNKKAGVLGALLSAGTFITTVSIIPFMPGGWNEAAGFPAMQGNVAFLMKSALLSGCVGRSDRRAPPERSAKLPGPPVLQPRQT